MNVMIDTNVVIDDILNRLPNAIYAQRISDLIVDSKLNGYLTANSLTDIYYIAGKKYCNEVVREIVRDLLKNYRVASVSGQDCLDALDLPIEDFEDALVVVCAKNAQLDYIITNDSDFLNINLSVPLISPSGFLALFDE